MTTTTTIELKPLNNIGFAEYRDTRPGIRLFDLLIEQHLTGCLFARVEDSGCEACYVEVARWSNDRGRWERAYFAKIFGGYDIGESYDGLRDDEACAVIADTINSLSCDFRTMGPGRETVKLVACLPNAHEPTQEEIQKVIGELRSQLERAFPAYVNGIDGIRRHEVQREIRQALDSATPIQQWKVSR